jgi:gluconolactonase
VLNQTALANGATLSSDGALIICMQGNTTFPGHLLRLDLTTGQQSVVADNWFGLQFNSPNDVVQGLDGSFYFTDPSYGL